VLGGKPRPAGALPDRSPGRHPLAARWHLDWFELLVLVAFAAVSMWVVALDIYYANTHGGVAWTLVDGEFPGDQLGYLAWIRDASHHVLVSDLYVPWATPHDYLQPMIAISGALVALGMAPWLALMLWKPVAVLTLFFVVRAYCRRMLPGRWERRAALVLGLFGAAWGVLGDEWLPALSWGYLYALMAVAMLVGALLAYDTARSTERVTWAAPVLGLLASWLNPWEGEILVLIIVGVELVAVSRPLRRDLARLKLPALMLAATALPLVYYAALGRFDSQWKAAHAVIAGDWGLQTVLLPLIPLLVAAAFAYRRRPNGFLQAATLAWPLATLADWALNQTSLGVWSLHSLTGVTIPLGVLAVIGVRNAGFRRLPGRAYLGAAAVAALTVPATVAMMRDVPVHLRPASYGHNLIATSDDLALRFLAADPDPGMVLTDYDHGVDVPAATGRRTYTADLQYWTQPGVVYRGDQAERLLHGPGSWWAATSWWWYKDPPVQVGRGWLIGGRAAQFVRSTGARFVLENCGGRADLSRWLRPILRSVHRFGCATVYEVS
jgi:hypothetical protein